VGLALIAQLAGSCPEGDNLSSLVGGRPRSSYFNVTGSLAGEKPASRPLRARKKGYHIFSPLAVAAHISNLLSWQIYWPQIMELSGCVEFGGCPQADSDPILTPF
jgi:hypothetical protein